MGKIDGHLGLDATRPGAEHDDPAGHEDGLVDVVGDEHHRLLRLFPDAQQQLLHQHARLVVERAERLVEQQDLGVVGQRAGDRHPLLHAARELLGKMILETAQPDLGDEAVADLVLLRKLHALLAQAETDVLADVEPGEERVALEHHAAVGAGAHDPGAVEPDLAGRRRLEPGDQPQQGGLAAARRAQHRDEVVVGDFEPDRQQRLRRRGVALVAGKDLGNVADRKLAHLNRLHEKSCWFTFLNSRSDSRPTRPITTMPAMMWSVAISAWLSVIMWPIPDEAPISSATMM